MYSFTFQKNGAIRCYYYYKSDPSNKKKKASKLLNKTERSTFVHTYGYFYGMVHNILDEKTGVRYYLLPIPYNHLNMHIHHIKID